MNENQISISVNVYKQYSMSYPGILQHKPESLLGLPRDLSYIPDKMQRRAKLELFEDEDTRINSLKLLRSMMKEEKGLVWYDEDWFLLAFLRARKFDVKRAFNLVKNSFTVMGKRGELYNNYNFDDVRRAIKAKNTGFLPFRDEEGCAILIIRVHLWDPYVNSMGDHMRALTSGLLQAIRSPATQIAGFKVIVDMKSFDLHLLPHITPKYLLLFAEALQNAFPGRFRAVHIVNENFLFSYVWSILKQFLKKKLRDRFHFHGKEVKKLHKYFSPTILPADYEGDLPPFDNSEWVSAMEECSDFLVHFFTMGQGYEKYRVKAQKKSEAEV